MKLTTIRRWGQNDAGTEIEVTETEGQWLLANNYASEDGSDDAARAGARAPGTYGADPRAGGDLSRGGGMQVVRGGRGSEDAPMNRAHRVEGAPRPGGPVYLTPFEVEAKREQAELAERQRTEARAAAEKGEPRPATGSPAEGKEPGDGNETTKAARSASSPAGSPASKSDAGKAETAGKSASK